MRNLGTTGGGAAHSVRAAAALGMICAAFGSTPAAAEAPVTAAAIQGEWVSDCTPIGRNGRHGHVIRLTITPAAITAKAQLYAGNSCDTPTLSAHYAGVVRGAREQGGRIALDYEVREATFTLQREDVAAHYNRGASAGCGLSGWQVGVPRSVAGRRCGPIEIPPAGQALFESAWLSGDELRLGAFPLHSANRTPEARPEAPGTMVFRRVAAASRGAD